MTAELLALLRDLALAIAASIGVVVCVVDGLVRVLAG